MSHFHVHASAILRVVWGLHISFWGFSFWFAVALFQATFFLVFVSVAHALFFFSWCVLLLVFGFVVVSWNRSASPPGGNQVDGLQPALSVARQRTKS